MNLLEPYKVIARDIFIFIDQLVSVLKYILSETNTRHIQLLRVLIRDGKARKLIQYFLLRQSSDNMLMMLMIKLYVKMSHIYFEELVTLSFNMILQLPVTIVSITCTHYSVKFLSLRTPVCSTPQSSCNLVTQICVYWFSLFYHF